MHVAVYVCRNCSQILPAVLYIIDIISVFLPCQKLSLSGVFALVAAFCTNLKSCGGFSI